MIQHKRSVGFTLVELMLAMAFVGVLLVAIAVTTMHIMGTYTKGLTVREVNQAGRTISEDIQRTIAASVPFDVGARNGGEAANETDSKYIERDGGGRLCTGAFTYAWNYGYTNELNDAYSTHVYNTYTDSANDILLVKVNDSGGALCLDPSQQILKSDSKELLSQGDRKLVVQKFAVTEGARDDISGQAMYAITLILGTNDSTNLKILNASNTSCLAPKKSANEEASDNENFCAINQFNIIARAGNRSGSL